MGKPQRRQASGSTTSRQGRGQKTSHRPHTPRHRASSSVSSTQDYGERPVQTPHQLSVHSPTHQLNPVVPPFAYTSGNPSHLSQTWSPGSSSPKSTSGLSVVTNDSDGFPTVRSRSSKPHHERRERELQSSPTSAGPSGVPDQTSPPSNRPGFDVSSSTVPPGYRSEDRGQSNLFDCPIESIPNEYPPLNIDPARLGWYPGPSMADRQHQNVLEPPPGLFPNDGATTPYPPGQHMLYTPEQRAPYPGAGLGRPPQYPTPQYPTPQYPTPQIHYPPPQPPIAFSGYEMTNNPSYNPQSPSAPYMPGLSTPDLDCLHAQMSHHAFHEEAPPNNSHVQGGQFIFGPGVSQWGPT